MPSSATSALSASPSDCVDASDCDREPARDNVFPTNVDDHRRPTLRTRRLHRDAGVVDCDKPALDDSLRLTAPIADVDPLAIEPFVVATRAQGALGAGRRDLELVATLDQ